MIEIELLEELVVFSKAGSLLKAGEILHISQPALSKSRKKLETELGIYIFVRSKNKRALNENGKEILSYAEDIVHRSQKLLSRAKERKEEISTLSIGYVAPGPTFRFQNLFNPGRVRKKVVSERDSNENLIRGLFTGKYDLVFLNKECKCPEVLSKKIRSERLFVSVPKTHFLSGRKKGVYFRNIDGQSFLLFNYIGAWEEVLKKHLKESRFLRSSDYDELKEIVEFSSIPSFVTDLTIEKQTPKDRIILPILDEDSVMDFYVTLRKKNERLLDCVK